MPDPAGVRAGCLPVPNGVPGSCARPASAEVDDPHQLHPVAQLPGATTWNVARDAGHLDGIALIYLVNEPDQGDEADLRWLATSSIRDRVRLVDLAASGVKDVSVL